MALPKYLTFLFISAFVGACTSTAITPEASDPELPADWARGAAAGQVGLSWLDSFNDPQLTALVREAVSNNYQLEQERARLAQTEYTVTVVRADRFPQLDVSLGGSRRGIEATDGTRVTATSFDASLDARWEVDLWGRLSKKQQSAQLQMEAQRAKVIRAERELAADTAVAMFTVMQESQLLEVAERRLANVEQSREIVASGYRQGLNDALDLYLARNQVERQQANLAQQEQVMLEAVADLQLKLAYYPDGRMKVAGTLPVITTPIPVGLPSELLVRRSDLQEAWLGLLAADANLAAAHKARFPQLNLVGSTGVASLELGDLLQGDGVTWSLLGNLAQPVFQGGRLKAQELAAAEQVRIVEQQYLQQLFRAFADVENAISRDVSLNERYQSFLDAEANSSAALTLALEQYQKGLVSYTTVLESQRQAFDAEATVVQLRNQLLQNRINLHLALGGEFTNEL
jgi:multidrug efflux system outer membrane protein